MQQSPKQESLLDISILGFKSLSSPNFADTEAYNSSSALSSPRSPSYDATSDENNPLSSTPGRKTLRVRRHTEADLPTRKLSDEISPRSVKSLSLDEIDPSTSPKERSGSSRSLRRDSGKNDPEYERRVLSQSHRKHSDPDLKHHKHKKTTISSSSLAKSIYSIQYSFDYFESRMVLCERMLRAVMDVSGSDFGFMGFLDSDEDTDTPIKRLRIYSILISLDDVRLAPQQMDAMIKELEEDFTKPNSIYGAAATNRHIFIFNESPTKMMSGSPADRCLPLMKNFAGIPLYRHTREPLEKRLLGLVGIANRKEGMYSSELIASFLPLMRACEVLIQAHISFRQIYEQTEIQKLITRMKDAAHGIELKDRRQFVRTYKNCFSGRDVVNWVAMSASSLDIRTREDSAKLGTKLLAMGAFHHLIGGNTNNEVLDDNTVLYSFKEDGDNLYVEDPPSPRGSTGSDESGTERGTLTKRRSRSILSHLSSEILNQSQNTSDKRYQLHAIISKKDYYSLKKKLTKKKVIDQLNSMNEKDQTALHIAIENDDSNAVELLMTAYLSNINKVNIHLKDKNGYTPLHCAAEVGNPKILTALLSFPGVQTNIPNITRNTPFHCFCYRFPSPSNMKQIFDMFISRGTNLNATNIYGETPLHKAVLNPSVRLLMVRLLLESGPVEVNAFTEKGETALHYAIHLRRRDLVSALLNYGADPMTKYKGSEKSAYEVALEEGDPEISLLLFNTIELSEWLSSIDMKQYLSLFIKELVFKDVLLVINEKTLVDLGITWAGDRLRILQAIQKLKQDAEAKALQSTKALPKLRLTDFKKFRMPSTERIRMPASKSLSPVSSIEKEMKKHFEGEEWIKYSDLEFTELLGSGTSGDVYRGYYKGEEVAIKVLEKEREHRLEEFKFEFKIMSAIRGPNIVHFYGACLEPKPCLIMEFCSRGSLYDLLNDSKIDFKWPDLLRISLEMTEAIDILHNNEPQILHRDLKSMNFLVTKDWIIKVSDFGLSRFNTNTNMSTLHELRGTMSYCAPETFQGKHYTTKGDIYSLGILFWEMMYRCVTGEYQRPYAEYSYLTQPLQIIVQTAQQGLRPTLPNMENVPRIFVDLVTRCWDPVPGNRPDTKEIAAILLKSMDDYDADPAPWNACILASAQLTSSAETPVSVV